MSLIKKLERKRRQDMIDRIIKMLVVGAAAIATLVSIVSPIAITICTGEWGAMILILYAPILCAVLFMTIKM